MDVEVVVVVPGVVDVVSVVDVDVEDLEVVEVGLTVLTPSPPTGSKTNCTLIQKRLGSFSGVEISIYTRR